MYVKMMASFPTICIVMCLTTTVSAFWSGIGIVGQNHYDGQVYIPDQGCFKKDDNFGFNNANLDTTSTACNCKFYTSGGGGLYDGHYYDTIYESDPRTDQSRLLTRMTMPRRYHSMTCVGNDTLIICGGQNAGGYLNSCEICHLANPICVPTFPMPQTVWLHNAVVSRNHLYVLGGKHANSISPQVLDFSLVDESWTQRQSMLSARDQQPGAILLTSGHIMVCGGEDYTNHVINTCESYDPLSNAWTSRPSMHTARANFAVVRLDGRVYAVGGYIGENGHKTVELYDEYYDSWSVEEYQLLDDHSYQPAAAIDGSCVS